ncbi:MAG: hypothetical protein COA96_12210 [SAR86 cluster bacterium]|uniref:Uncharacterized protein n=1 Tax=SAR86 cluster bacterium TaxID=2030880 RepID=A0A2A5AVE5_9GAMM|nr:MAG: hypothetical protein COA96_12210 [SAR86 cluster bacterium]
MLKRKLLNFFAIATTAVFPFVDAQELQLDSLQRNIDIFSGVLEDALDFKESRGLFGVSLGGIDSMYLYGQGVVLEVRTPLSSSRNRISLASLNSAMQSLQSRTSLFESTPFSRSPGQVVQESSLSLAATTADSSSFYADMMDKIANIDYSVIMNNAIQQASDSVRALRSIGNVDSSVLEVLSAEISVLREDMRVRIQELREVEDGVRSATSQNAVQANSNAESELRAKLDELMAKIEPLRDQIVTKAEELQQRRELAEQTYASQWEQEVVEFESKLYAAMCDYGSTLRELPDNESVTIILTGLGELTQDQRRTDKLHIFNKSDLLLCQSGEINLTTLQQRSVQYSY